MKKEQIPLIYRADSLERRNQILTVAGAVLSLFGTGTIMGFSSVTLPTLLGSDPHIKASNEDLSWIASLVLVGCLLGTLIGGLASDVIGRKKTIILSSVFYCIGWIIIAEATDLADLLTGRILTGLASGFYSATVQVYIVEIVEPSMRGVSGSLPTLMVSVGIFSIYCLGSVFDWRTVALVCSIFPLFVLSYVIFLPESPVWLISRGRQPEALKSLTWLRNNPEEAEQECMRLQYLKERRAVQNFSFASSCPRLFHSSVLKPLFIGSALFFFQQFSGIYPITFYSTLIFHYADSINDYIETIAIGVVRMFATLVAIFLVNFIPRRPLLIASALLMAFSNISLGTFFYLKENPNLLKLISNISTNLAESSLFGSDQFNMSLGNLTSQISSEELAVVTGPEWIPLTCLLLFMAGYSIGFGIIPWFLVAEILPSDARSLGCSLAFAFNQICLFTTVKTFLDMMDTFYTYGTFWFYGVVALCAFFFVTFFVPETSNLHHGEIEEIFEQKHPMPNMDDDEETTGF